MKRQKTLFNSLFFTDILSDFGDTLYYLALLNYILLLPDSKMAIAIITLSESLPIFLKVVTGYLADRTRHKVNGIMITQVLRFILYLIIGLLISFKPALWIILAISLINLLSDIAGQFENGLYLPIELNLIEEDKREEVFANTQSISAISNIIFRVAGAFLVTWISFQTLAFVNAYTFLACAGIMWFIKARLKTFEGSNELPEEQETSNSHFIEELKSAVVQLKAIPNLLSYLLIISLINGLFSISTPLIVASIAQYGKFIIINPATTISLSGIIVVISSIVGSIAANTLFKNVMLKNMIYSAIISLPLLFSSFVSQQIWWCFILLGVLGVIGGGTNPKFYGFLMNNLPPEKIGMLTGAIGTIVQIGIFVTQIAFSLLVSCVSIATIAWIYLVSSILLTIYFVAKQFLNNKRRYHDITVNH